MHRLHLFEIEDQAWFPSTLRTSMTQMLMRVHEILGTPKEIAGLLAGLLERTGQRAVVDLCSGSGGPMPQVLELLESDHNLDDVSLTLTDLYPHEETVATYASNDSSRVHYANEAVDAAHVGEAYPGVRTLICGFHHMRPENARKILRDARDAQAPLFIFELSDNSIPPRALWWIGMPLNILFALFVSATTRPFSIFRMVFTWLIPVLPLCFAWDGAVSNVRTYTQGDMEELLEDIRSDQYDWEMGTLDGTGGRRSYLMGWPKHAETVES